MESTQLSVSHEQIEIPPRLLPHEKRFNDNRKNRTGCKCTASYRQIYALAMNAEYSLEEIGRACGGNTKQWAQQILNEYYPGVRPQLNGRRRSTGKLGRKARARREIEKKNAIEAAFRENCKRFKLLAAHANAAGFSLAPVWRNDLPMHKEAYIDDERCFVMLLTAPAQLQPNILYAHSLSPREATLKGFAHLVLVVEIDRDGVRMSRVYKIPVKTFLEKQQTNILIRITPRKANNVRKPAIDWELYLLSKFA